MYLQMLRFLLPLALATIAPDLSRQFLNGGMARVPQATETLASFGLAWGIVSFLSGALVQTRQLGLVLADGEDALRTVRRCVMAFGSVPAGVLAALAFTPLGVWVVEDLHNVPPTLGPVVRDVLCWMIPIPILEALRRFLSGLLIRIRRTAVVGYATFTGIGSSIAAVFLLLPLDVVQHTPTLLPVFVTYIGILTELSIMLSGYRKHKGQFLEEVGRTPSSPRRGPLTAGYVLRFYWPLALIMAVQGGSRPLVNLFVSRGPDGTEALAVLTVVYPLAHIPYGWLNEIRNLPSAFRNMDGSLRYIRRYALGCGLLSFCIMAFLFWTPVRVYILETLVGVDAALAARCAAPLVIFSFFPLAVMMRAYLHGVALREHRTRVLAPSGPSRILAIVAMLFILPRGDMAGATRGTAALLSGFVLETLVVWRGVRGRFRT